MRPIRAPNGDDVDAYVQFRRVRKFARPPGPVTPKPSSFNIPLPNERSGFNRTTLQPLPIRLLRTHLANLGDCRFDNPAFVVSWHECVVLYWDNPGVIVPHEGADRSAPPPSFPGVSSFPRVPSFPPSAVIPAKAGIHPTPSRTGAHAVSAPNPRVHSFYPLADRSANPNPPARLTLGVRPS